MPQIEDIQHPVILFDGVCNLCNNAVQFVIKRDKQKLFKFASLQSSFGQAILKTGSLPQPDFNSFILLQNATIYTKSTAALMVARQLSAPWSLLYFFIIVPPFIRDGIYKMVANNRYKWFGKKDTCFTPTPGLRTRFLD